LSDGQRRALLEIHVAVLLFGFAGLFGKWLTLPAWCIVLGRTGFATLALLAVWRFSPPQHLPVNLKTVAQLGLLGGGLAVHWLAFFKAIQVASVSVGLLAFATFPVFITGLEPLWFKEKRRRIDYLTAVMVVLGLGIMIYPSSFGGRIFAGVLWGTFAGFTFAVLSILNRKWVRNYSPVIIALFQNGFATLALLPMLLLREVRFDPEQIGLLALLGVLCTALAHTLFIQGLKFIRAQLASVIATLEPVYGIALAFLLLHEIPSAFTLAGGSLILLTTLLAMGQRASG
jgi:drug/metabolite transporter (DMT)-like permease